MLRSIRASFLGSLTLLAAGCSQDDASGSDSATREQTDLDTAEEERSDPVEGGAWSPAEAGAGVGAETDEVVTYADDLFPLMDRECFGCHGEGGIAPLELSVYEVASLAAPLMVEAVESQEMPPWLPSAECLPLEHARGLDDSERALFRQWFEQGMAPGDLSGLESEARDGFEFEATHIARMKEPYLPNGDESDDYRCFVLDMEFTEDSFVSGRQVVPGAGGIVHHVLVYAANPSQRAAVEEYDAAEEGPGYTCFGGPLPAADTAEDSSRDTSAISMVNLGGWVPGQVPAIQPEGRATFVPAGSQLILQVHYNLLEQAPTEDSTEVHLILSDEAPERQLRATPVAVLDLDIPAGASEVVEERVLRNFRSEAMRIVGFTPHMHLLGTKLELSRVPAEGDDADEQCMVDIPRWDFEWQQNYTVPEEHSVVVEPGEGLKLSCTFDNSEGNQPIVGGQRQEPRDVDWGEGTLDEMCLVYLMEESDWSGNPAVGCEAAEQCLDDCDSTAASCLLNCEGLDGGCRACVLQATAGCAAEACVLSYLAAADCLQECIMGYVLLGGSYEDCVRAECPDAAGPAFDCIFSEIEAGACAEELTECDVIID